MKKTITSFLLVGALMAGLAAFSRGPIGPESVVAKEVAGLIEDAALGLKAHITGPNPIEVKSVPLATGLEVKRALKFASSTIGVTSAVSEAAEQYTFEFESAQFPSPIRFLVRVRGDHVLSIALDQRAPPELAQAIRTRFPGYAIHVIDAVGMLGHN